ncbi:MAG: hypothetical protein LBJ63_05255 [Prevotellaceae bacterium]|nr:hypothetical protein [Prevotellaceae bacterium]
MKQEIKLGQKVRDMVTGFEGIAIARIEYLNGCIQYCVKPQSQKGEMPESEYIDHQQLEVVGDGVDIIPTGEPGGFMPDMPKAR